MTTAQTTPDSPLLTRHPKNPILTAGQWPYRVNTIFNAGAVKLKTGETLLLCRVEDCRGISHLCAARSPNGVDQWTIDQQPTLPPQPADYPEETWGIEDPRVVWHPEMGKYSITYCAYSSRGPVVSLALTEDFRSFHRFGMVLPPENKDASLLPKQIDGRWMMIHRPVPYSVSGAHIWICSSTDLEHWGNHRLVLSTRSGPWWDGSKIGLSSAPIETSEGLLITYHGARQTVAGQNYYVGLALLDHRDPSRCLRRSSQYLLAPATEYERNGEVDNVVFPCGHTIAADGDTLNLYYGAADTSIGLATGSIRQLLDWLKEQTD